MLNKKHIKKPGRKTKNKKKGVERENKTEKQKTERNNDKHFQI